MNRQPEKFTPSNNPIVFTLTGSSDVVYLKLQLKEAETQSTVFVGNIFPTPNAPTMANVNLSNQLSALVKSDVDNASDIVLTKPKNIIGYDISYTEYGLTTGGTLNAIGNPTTGGTFYAFEAGLDIQNFTNYSDADYVSYSANPTSFLTFQENNKAVNDFSFEQLYYLHSGYTKLNVTVNAGGVDYHFPITGATGIVGETKASTVISGYTNPFLVLIDNGGNSYLERPITYIQVIEPILGSIMLYAGRVVYTTDADEYTTVLVNNINQNTYGYTATKLSSTSFRVTGRSGIGSALNTYPCYFSVTDDDHGLQSLTGIFSGGINGTPSALPMDKMIRLQVSPKQLIGAGAALTKGQDYTVRVKESPTGNTISEIRTYKYKDIECGLDYVNIAFTNSIGGVDSIQLVNPQESINVSKLSIKRNNINLNNDDVYLTNGIFNVSDLVYDTSSKYSFKAYTQPLSDEQADWLNEMIISKNHYLELKSGELLPVILKTTNYSLQKKKYLQQQPNTFQFEFELPDGFIPAITSDKLTIN